MNICCFCKLPVLGIIGQDDLLDSYNFRESEDDELAILYGVYGDCHIKCLFESPWSDFWSTRRLQNYTEVRGFHLIYDDKRSRVYRPIATELRRGVAGRLAAFRTKRSLILLESNVLLPPISDSRVRKGLDVENSVLRVAEEERWWELPKAVEAKDVEDLFNPDGRMSLLELSRIFGVTDKLYDLHRAQESKLSAIRNKTAEGLKKRILMGTVISSVAMPVDLTNYLSSTLRVHLHTG